MLDGTDLFAAFQPMGSQQNDPYATLYSPVNAAEEQSVAVQEKNQEKKELIRSPMPAPIEKNMYDANNINKQYETEQRLNNILNQIKEKKQVATTSYNDNHQGYFDRLFGKKKELFKILQLALIITLGLSVHFLIDYYLKNYLQETDMSFERQLFIRLLYPIAILFILWNLKVFVK